MLEPIECERDKEITDDEYNEFLDECYGPFEIGSIKFDASRILSELDPIAYSCGKSDYEDSLETEDYWECPLCKKEYGKDEEELARYCCQEEEFVDEDEID